MVIGGAIESENLVALQCCAGAGHKNKKKQRRIINIEKLWRNQWRAKKLSVYQSMYQPMAAMSMAKYGESSMKIMAAMDKHQLAKAAINERNESGGNEGVIGVMKTKIIWPKEMAKKAKSMASMKAWRQYQPVKGINGNRK
jgi:hypothetical protein